VRQGVPHFAHTLTKPLNTLAMSGSPSAMDPLYLIVARLAPLTFAVLLFGYAVEGWPIGKRQPKIWTDIVRPNDPAKGHAVVQVMDDHLRRLTSLRFGARL
jgi:hypothetical protein